MSNLYLAEQDTWTMEDVPPGDPGEPWPESDQHNWELMESLFSGCRGFYDDPPASDLHDEQGYKDDLRRKQDLERMLDHELHHNQSRLKRRWHLMPGAAPHLRRYTAGFYRRCEPLMLSDRRENCHNPTPELRREAKRRGNRRRRHQGRNTCRRELQVFEGLCRSCSQPPEHCCCRWDDDYDNDDYRDDDYHEYEDYCQQQTHGELLSTARAASDYWERRAREELDDYGYHHDYEPDDDRDPFWGD